MIYPKLKMSVWYYHSSQQHCPKWPEVTLTLLTWNHQYIGVFQCTKFAVYGVKHFPAIGCTKCGIPAYKSTGQHTSQPTDRPTHSNQHDPCTFFEGGGGTKIVCTIYLQTFSLLPSFITFAWAPVIQCKAAALSHIIFSPAISSISVMLAHILGDSSFFSAL